MTGMFGGRGARVGVEGEDSTMVVIVVVAVAVVMLVVDGEDEYLDPSSRGGVAGLSCVLIVSAGLDAGSGGSGGSSVTAGLLGIVPPPLSMWLASLAAGLLTHGETSRGGVKRSVTEGAGEGDGETGGSNFSIIVLP